MRNILFFSFSEDYYDLLFVSFLHIPENEEPAVILKTVVLETDEDLFVSVSELPMFSIRLRVSHHNWFNIYGPSSYYLSEFKPIGNFSVPGVGTVSQRVSHDSFLRGVLHRGAFAGVHDEQESAASGGYEESDSSYSRTSSHHHGCYRRRDG